MSTDETRQALERQAAPKEERTISPLRRRRLHRVLGLRAQGLTSFEIGARLGLAPSTVRDYWNDPFREQARWRHTHRRVVKAGHARWVKTKWARGGPAQTKEARGRQLRAMMFRRAS